MQTLSEVPRDRWKRPLIVPPEGGKPVPYTRCTTYVGALEDTYNLEKWKCRQTAIGMALRPDLVMAVASLAPQFDKSAVDAHVEAALEHAGSTAAATIGTAIHKFTEDVDACRITLADVPAVARPDVEAYLNVMRAAKLTVQQIECFVVQDAIKVGGTFDRVIMHNGKRFILDVKTGQTLDFGMGKIAMQLAVYAHSRAYDPASHARTDLDVDLERAIVAHVPSGQGKAYLRWVDIATGWDGVGLARQVREWRKLKNLSEPLAYEHVEPEMTPEQADLLRLIECVTTVSDLNRLWFYNKKAWTPTHTEASKTRKAQLT